MSQTDQSLPENLFPEHAVMMGREQKEALLQQKGLVVWMYGLSGSGKSTLAAALEKALHAQGKLVKVLDGDNIRTGLNRNLGFSDEDREENIRRIAEVAKLFLDLGSVVITSFITPQRDFRQSAREIVGTWDFLEVYVKASFEECARRDVKGLYAKAKAGKVASFTGKDSSFEEPTAGDDVLVLDTEAKSKEECLRELLEAVVARTAP